MNISTNSNKALNAARTATIAQNKANKKASQQQVAAKLKNAMSAYTRSDSRLEQDNIQRDVVTLLSSSEVADSAYFKKVKGQVGQIFTKNQSAWNSSYAAKSRLPETPKDHLQSFAEQITSQPLTAKSFFHKADVKKLKNLASLGQPENRLAGSEDEDDPGLDIVINNVLDYQTAMQSGKKRNPKKSRSQSFNAVG